jgi:hypothetical protein
VPAWPRTSVPVPVLVRIVPGLVPVNTPFTVRVALPATLRVELLPAATVIARAVVSPVPV